MCSRYSRAREALDYVAPLMPGVTYCEPGIFRPSYNIAPDTKQPVISSKGPDLMRWGYRPASAFARQVPTIINCQLHKSGTAAWKAMWKTRRVIVPADYWYEWSLEAGKKQPYCVAPIDGKPLFFAGLASVKPDAEHLDGDGFVIVTDTLNAGLLNTHDPRPVVFGVQEAREWLDPKTRFEDATHLANHLAAPRETFRWFRVSAGVNQVGNDEPAFNDPIDETY